MNSICKTLTVNICSRDGNETSDSEEKALEECDRLKKKLS